MSTELFNNLKEDKKNTHSWYTAGMFLEKREENKALNKLLSWMENLLGVGTQSRA